jgi:SAM-dependent methyltransferase
LKFLFAGTLLLNALLLFLVQPMVARILLPYLGGAPSVWNTCMVFFQAMLLCGYAYAHLTTRWLSARRQTVLHLILLASAVLCFPLEISESAVQSLNGETQPIWWLLGRLLAMVGLPFFMLSTGGPLLQQWFSTTNQAGARDPYFLYGASNLGSLAALLGYPFLLEPAMRLRQQTWLWAFGYVLLLGLIAACAWARAKLSLAPVEVGVSVETGGVAEPLGWGRRGRWLLLAFVPSTLMLSVTTFLSTDISPVPLLWIIPLALYLVTFILAFARRQWISMRLLSRVGPLLALALVVPMLLHLRGVIWLLAPMHLLFFFIAALICHRQLADERPHASRLTEFYLWMSLGGMLGGLFNSVVAPNLFDSIVEYPLGIVLALLLRPRGERQTVAPRVHWLDFAAPAGVFILTSGLLWLLARQGMPPVKVMLFSLLASMGVASTFASRPLRFGLAMAAIFASGTMFSVMGNRHLLHTERNFFGVLRVARDPNGTFQQFFYGTTLHGQQFLDPRRQCEPLSYYHRNGPLGQAFDAFSASPASPDIAVVGLGTGAMASYARPGENWTYYEIDPSVREIAQDSRYFTYLPKCAATPMNVILGDARLQLRNAANGLYGLIVLDAFSSDAVPTHLLTRQALELYVSKLAPGGRLLFHISNRFLNLRVVTGNLAGSAGLIALASEASPSNLAEGQEPAVWVTMARRAEDLGGLRSDPRWRQLEGDRRIPVWTDDYSNILSVLDWR